MTAGMATGAGNKPYVTHPGRYSDCWGGLNSEVVLQGWVGGGGGGGGGRGVGQGLFLLSQQ